MPSSPLVLTVAGQTYRVHSDANPDHLRHLARLLDERIAHYNSHARLSPIQALLFAALTLTDDLEKETALRHSVETRARHSLTDLVRRIDSALETTDTLLKQPASPPNIAT